MTILALTTMMCGLTVPAAQGKTACTNASLNGSYGLRGTGVINGVGNFAAIGLFHFDGKGNLTATLFTRVNGMNSTLALTGSYTVSQDCTVTDAWRTATGDVSVHQAVIVDNGNGYYIMNVTVGDGSTISAEAKKQFPGSPGDSQ
jgi:hypothetical protein